MRIGFDQVRFKTFSLGSYTDDGQQSEYGYLVPKDPELQRHQTETVSLTCDVPLYQTVVFWNGDLGLCCIDYDQVIKLPSVDKVGFVKPPTSPTKRPRRGATAIPRGSRSARTAPIPTPTIWASSSTSGSAARPAALAPVPGPA